MFNFFLQNLAVCEIMWKNILERGRPQMKIRRMCIACRIWGYKHPDYVFPFPLQQLLHENAPLLHFITLSVLLSRTSVRKYWPRLLLVDCIWNVMAHAQKPNFVFRRNGRVHLNRRGRQFSRLLAAEVCASAVVMLDTPCSEVVWRVLATHSIRHFPLHFPSRASPCTITFQLDFTTVLLLANTRSRVPSLYPKTLHSALFTFLPLRLH